MNRQEVNDHRVLSFPSAEMIAFVCECADEGCRRSVLLSPRAFIARREHGDAILFARHVPVEDAAMAREHDYVAMEEPPVLQAALEEERPAEERAVS